MRLLLSSFTVIPSAAPSAHFYCIEDHVAKNLPLFNGKLSNKTTDFNFLDSLPFAVYSDHKISTVLFINTTVTFVNWTCVLYRPCPSE